MSRSKESLACSTMPSKGGLLVFLNLRALIAYTITLAQNPTLHLKIQAGQPAGLNLHFNPPTVYPQRQPGDAHKAVAYPLGTSRFCVFAGFWPYIRGRDGPG